MDAQQFHLQLEQVLREKNPAALRQFLVAQGQWQEDATIDPERAMWTMILGKPALAPLHQEAHAWLVAHGHQADAAMLRRDQSQKGTQGAPSAKAKSPRQKPKRKPGGAPESKRLSGPERKA
jgi:hypothetical protein